jgi:hypothetical protein
MRILKRICLFLVFSMLFTGIDSSAQRAVKPKTLGPYEMGRNVSVKSLYLSLGITYDARKRLLSCFKSDESGFLWFSTLTDDPKMVGGILLSSFPNCVDKPILSTLDNLKGWKTKEGIGLGSSKGDVLKAYGKPARLDIVKGNDYRWIVSGDFKNGHYSSKPMPERGKEVIVFLEPDSVYVSEFGIDNDKVVWIFISENE